MEAQKTHKTCAIYKCGNRMAPIFRFPHPKRGLDRFMAWVKASNNPKFEGLTNDQIYRRGYICYQHFRAEDYVQGTQRLHQSAVPTILPPRDDTLLISPLEASKIDASTVVPQTTDLIFLTPRKECPDFYSMANLSPRIRRTPHSQSSTTTPERRNIRNSGIQARQLNFGEENGVNELPCAGPSGLQSNSKIGKKNFCSYHSRGSNCEQDEDSFVITIREFLGLQINRKCVEDQWKPPPVPDTVTKDKLYDQNVIGYISGFLVKHMSKEPLGCEICRSNLKHDGDPDIQYHGLVEKKEYDDKNRRLQYTNVGVIKTLIETHNHLRILLPSAIYHSSLSRRIISHLRTTIDFDFQECLHTEELKTKLFHLFVRVFIFGYMKKLSNIVFGRQEPNRSISLETEMQKLYLRFKRK